MRSPADLVELEAHNNGYGQKGALTSILWPNGSVSACPQVVPELTAALTLARLEMER